jgi:alanyl-tRNA synthetase
LKASELRKSFLKFFEDKGHTIKPSFSLIPEDPSLLFTVAGMVPFKNYFLGKVPLTFTRAATSQKCIRTNDIENVGRTRRHHTFFEMLGNFSFGDYFKSEAIEWAWEFLTSVIKLQKDRMYITIYRKDDEAFEIWNKKMKVPAERIFRMGEDGNFWEMGATGPCGYCSEIYFDLEGGEKGVVTQKDIEENDDRFLEVWNLVFTQFDKKEDGTLAELKQKNIDTGMGLERLAAVSQGVYSNFETDLFMPIIKDAADKAGTSYGKNEKTDISLRVIADHARSVSFLIGDGVLPSNEGRGYVLRRVIRRAVRHGRLLGLTEPFLFKVVPAVVTVMKDAYPEIAQRKEYITQIIKLEEDKFQETMDKGIAMLDQEIDGMKKAGSAVLSGEAAFRLYDTFGFPVEITEEILSEQKMKTDRAVFNEFMERQREMAKKAWKGMNAELTAKLPRQLMGKLPVTKFMGYETMKEEGCRILAIIKGAEAVKNAVEGQEVLIVLDKTAFYAESGGQVGDRGEIISGGGAAAVTDTVKVDEIIIHRAKVTKGSIKEGDTAAACVDEARRKAIMKNHTATHLMQAALRSILGPHVEQAGSYVGEDRLRFDFTHFSQLTDEEIKKVERLVNKWVQDASPVNTEEMEFAEAKKRGAMALFEEKYKARVRTVTVPGVSMELCGGTHLKNTGEIGLFKVMQSSSTASGIRRIEAVTGAASLDLLVMYDDFIKSLKARFKLSETKEIEDRLAKVLAENREMEKEIQNMKKADILKDVDGYIKSAREINGVRGLTLKFKGAAKDAVRSLGDLLKQKMKKAAIVIANVQEEKVSFLAVVTDDLTDRLDASVIVKAVAAVCGGGGGGRRDMAEAGGKEPEKTDEALSKLDEILKAGLKP